MADVITLECEVLPGAPGWASCTVRSGEQTCEIGPFSQAVTAGLDDMVRATVCIVSGSWTQTFVIDGEPEPRWHWRLSRHVFEHELHVTIEVKDAVDSDPGEVVFRGAYDPDDFGRAVLAMMKAMTRREPPESLRKRWGRLPHRATAALEAALAVPLEQR